MGYIIDQNNEGSSDNSGSSPGTTNGLPVYDLTTTQVSSIVSSIELGGNNPPTAGKYAIEIWTDTSGTHNKKLVRAQQVSGQWERKMNGSVIEQYDLKSHINDSQSALTELGSPTPIVVGYIIDQNNEGSSDNSGSSPGTTNGLPVYNLSQTQVDTLVGVNVANAGIYAVEIWTDSSGTENKKLVSTQQINEDWFRKENSNGDIEQYDLVPSYDSFDEVKTFLVTEGFMEPLTEQGTAEVTFVFVDGQPTGFIIDEEEDAEGSETTLSSNGTPIQWARTNGDSQSGVIYDLAQPIKVIAPTGYTVVLKNVVENEEYDTQQTVVDDVHAVLAATGNLDGKGYGGIFYKSDNNTDWDHWTTTYVAYAKPQTTDTEDQDSEEIITPQGLPVYNLSQTQVDTLVGVNVANAGIYAVEIWTDSSGTENKKLVSTQQINEDWFRKENSNGDIEQYDLVPSYDSFDEVISYISSQNLTPSGHIIDEEEEHHGPFNFTIIDEIDLNNPQELIDLSADHDDVWFQRVNLEDGRYIWALSVENDDENGSTSESSNLMVEMNGSVYEGDFHDYWRDAFDIMIDNNSTNWRENRFDANPEGIKNLLFQFPEIRGPNAPVSPMVKTDPPKSSFGNKATFVGKLITDGNNRNLSLGFQFSEDLRFNDVIEVLIPGDNFEAEYDFSKYESKYLYYRAFARNEEFESFGARKRLKIEVLATTKINGAKIVEGGWESSDWFGHYYIQENGWIYHEDLGWCFLVIQKNNHWLWMEKYGWLWTKPSVWPYLYDNENANWLYLLKRKSGPSLFFDRKIEQFLPIHN